MIPKQMYTHLGWYCGPSQLVSSSSQISGINTSWSFLPPTTKEEVYRIITDKIFCRDLPGEKFAFEIWRNGKRPTIPPDCIPDLAKLMEQCWQKVSISLSHNIISFTPP